MSITSLPFLALVAGGLVLYYLCPKGGRWVVLLALSCVFYLSGGWGAGCYLLFTALTTWAAGLALGRLNAALDALPAGEGRRAALHGLPAPACHGILVPEEPGRFRRPAKTAPHQEGTPP